jgi:protein subunit release factor B
VSKNDFEIQTFRGSGNGGQNRNKVETCVRMIHKESGAITLGVEERTQFQNKQIAFKKMVKNPKFNAWLKLKTARMLHEVPSEKQIEQMVEESMKEENLKIEYGKGFE